MAQRERSFSQTFEVDETQASGIFAKTLHQNNVFLSGSSVGKGLCKSARHYIEKEKTEDSFYVIDIGMVVSQGKYDSHTLTTLELLVCPVLFCGRVLGCVIFF